MDTTRQRSYMTATIAVTVFLVLATAHGCGAGQAPGGAGEDVAAPPSMDSAPTLEEMAEATYAGIFEEPVTLTDGRWEGSPFVEGGSSRPSAGLVEDFILTGDLNGDGREDAVVLLWESSGGSGTRSYLAAMGRANGAVVNLGTDLVGDRVQVKEGFITGLQITLDLIQAGPGDAACCPSQKAVVGWRLSDATLSRTETEITGTLSLEDLEGPDWVLTAIGWDTPVPEGPRATIRFEGDRVMGNGGCNGFFGTVTSEAPGRLAFSAMGTTMMACAEATMDVETRFLRTLAEGSSYSFVAGRLVIGCDTDAGPVPLIFTRPQVSETAGEDLP